MSLPSQWIDADGILEGTELTLASGSAEQRYPDLAYDALSGGYAVAWQEGASNTDIHGMMLDAGYNVLGITETLSAADNSQSRPALSYDADRGRFLAVWQDTRNAASSPDVYGQLYQGYTIVIQYAYDDLQRLVEAEYSDGTQFGYAYDAMNNWLRMTETTPLSGTVVTTYTYNAANQLVTARSDDDGITWHYTFDDRGSLLRQTPGGTNPADGETRYTYDDAGRLVQVELYLDGGYTTLAEAAYDGRGERTRLTTWAGGQALTVTYVVAGRQLLVADDGIQTTRYLYGQGLVAEHRSAWSYHLPDGTGSARQVVDEAGAVILARAYRPFGGILQEEGTYEAAFGFLGVQLDRALGLLYDEGRYYDPSTGRFLTPGGQFDPYHPRTLNRYVPLQGALTFLLVPLLLLAAYKRRKQRGGRGPWLLFLVAVLLTGMGVGLVVAGCGPITPPTEPPEPPTKPPEPPTLPTPTEPPTETPPPPTWTPLPPSPSPSPLPPTCTPIPPTPIPTPSPTPRSNDPRSPEFDPPAWTDREKMARAMFGEASIIWDHDPAPQGQGEKAMIAVGWSAIHRLEDDPDSIFPDTLSEILNEGAYQGMKEIFSGLDARLDDLQAWYKAVELTDLVVSRQAVDYSNGAVWFHDATCNPVKEFDPIASYEAGGYGLYFYAYKEYYGGCK